MSDKPTYLELKQMLETAPPRTMVVDQRYWDWRAKAQALLDRIPPK